MKHQIGQKVVYYGQVYEVMEASKREEHTIISRPYQRGSYIDAHRYTTDALDSQLLTEDEYSEKVRSFDDALKTAKEKMIEAFDAVSLAKELGANGVGNAHVLSDIATDIAEQCGVEWNSSNC